MVVFKMRDSLPRARYPPICNVLSQWKTLLIPIYRVYQLYDYICIHAPPVTRKAAGRGPMVKP